jgi:hypothetical protein
MLIVNSCNAKPACTRNDTHNNDRRKMGFFENRRSYKCTERCEWLLHASLAIVSPRTKAPAMDKSFSWKKNAWPSAKPA